MQDAFRPSDASFNKEEALKQFKSWLDNPQGPPPQPPGFGQPQYQQYQPYPQPYQQQNSPYQQQYGQYQQYPRQPVCPSYATSIPIPCKDGEYRQESFNEFGCPVFGSCISFDTRTEPPQPDGKNICPALPTVESCPAGEAKEVSFSSPECGTYYSCRPSNVVQPPPIQTASCEQYGSGWRTVDSSGNCFSPSMAEYRTANGTLYTCSAFPAYGCSALDIPPNPTPIPSGQREQVWNSQGLRSWIRTDADSSRIESLKQACANVVSQANIWMSGAGTQSSIDFGMPDPAKCSGAASCSSTQYFDGSACVSNTQTNTTSGSCSSELIGLLGSECHSMGSGWFNGEMTKYVTSYNSQTVRSCTTEPVSGCSGGDYAQPQSCPSGQYWSGSSCVTSTTQQPPTPCGSGQYWNGSSCVTSTTGDGTYGSECRSQSTQSACSTVSGCYWYTGYSGSYCDSAGSTVLSGTSCPSGQYWNGSSCVATTPYDTTYSTASAQQGCATAGGTWDSAANYCRMPTQTTTCASGQYWNGSSCVTTTSGDTSTSGTYVPPPTDSGTYTPPPTDSGTYTPPPTSTESAPISYIFCPEGHDWNGAYCTLSPRSPFERYTANAWSAFRSVFGF